MMESLLHKELKLKRLFKEPNSLISYYRDSHNSVVFQHMVVYKPLACPLSIIEQGSIIVKDLDEKETISLLLDKIINTYDTN